MHASYLNIEFDRAMLLYFKFNLFYVILPLQSN